jgi:hypothetical protein
MVFAHSSLVYLDSASLLQIDANIHDNAQDTAADGEAQQHAECDAEVVPRGVFLLQLQQLHRAFLMSAAVVDQGPESFKNEILALDGIDLREFVVRSSQLRSPNVQNSR